jgi:hypothetical protein
MSVLLTMMGMLRIIVIAGGGMGGEVVSMTKKKEKFGVSRTFSGQLPHALRLQNNKLMQNNDDPK